MKSLAHKFTPDLNRSLRSRTNHLNRIAPEAPDSSYDLSMNSNLLNRITFNPAQCGGRPCIRGMRIRVADILELLANGVSDSQILADFPDLERDDIRAALHYAAQRSDIVRLAA